MKQTYWTGSLGKNDDFGIPYKRVMYDAKTKQGPWANMTEESWKKHAYPVLGTGFGQKYEKQPDGKWLKVAG